MAGGREENHGLDQTVSKKKISPNLSPAIGSSLRRWLANLLAFGPPSFRFIPRVLFVSLVSLVGVPFRWWENFRLRKKLEKIELKDDPVFVLGHWRSGTTLIHNILCEDPELGYITLHQALFPHSFMTTGFFRLFLKVFMPETRPMDNMKLGIEAPQEDELALSNMARFSMYNGWQFPWRLMDFYRKYVEFDGLSQKGLESWWKDYIHLLKRATLNMNGKRLVLKNPAHTARVAELIKRFPNAKFIHIYRNPYLVYLSTRHLYKHAIPPFIVQQYSPQKMERDLLDIYERMMRNYFDHEHLIPKEQLLSMRYEEFAADPMPFLERLYDHLDLGDFERVREHFEGYLSSLGGYKKNVYDMDPKDVETVETHWGFALDQFGYELPS